MKPIEHLTDAELANLAAAASRLPDAPPEWVQAAAALWRRPPQPATESLIPALLRRLAAVLSFDSWGVPQPALGMRSLPGDSRHLLYSAEGRDIDVRIMARAERFVVAGQILGPDEAGEVELAATGAAGRRVTQLDALGEFRFDGLSAGTYEMTLRMGGDEILLPPIVIGPTSR